jgi:hypothetical protein
MFVWLGQAVRKTVPTRTAKKKVDFLIDNITSPLMSDIHLGRGIGMIARTIALLAKRGEYQCGRKCS